MAEEDKTLAEDLEQAYYGDNKEEQPQEPAQEQEVKPNAEQETEQPKEEKQDASLEQEQPQQTEAPEQKQETAKEEPKPEFNLLNEIKEVTGKEFKDDSELKTFFETKDQLSRDLESRKEKDEYYTQLEKEYRESLEKNDPLKKYGSEQEWHKAVVFDNLKEGKNLMVANAIVNDKVKDLDPLTAAAFGKMYNVPDLDVNTAKRVVLKSMGVNIDGWEEENGKAYPVSNPELNPDQLAALKVQAAETIDRFNTLKNNVQIPERVDYLKQLDERALKQKELREKNEKVWSEAVDKLIDTPPEIKYAFDDGSEFKVEYNKDDVKTFAELIKQNALSSNLEYSQQNMKSQEDLFKMFYIGKNAKKIFEAFKQEIRSDTITQEDDKIHNSQPINQDTKPEGDEQKLPTVDQSYNEAFNEAGFSE